MKDLEGGDGSHLEPSALASTYVFARREAERVGLALCHQKTRLLGSAGAGQKEPLQRNEWVCVCVRL